MFHRSTCFASDTLSLKVEVVGAGQDALPVQTIVAVLELVPDIAVLLAATRVNTVVTVFVVVVPPESRRPTRIEFSVTALPEIEPVIELVRMVTPLLAANSRVPEIVEPV